ncbi:MAG: GNAT family N-acetyltransferase [Candidatus Neomarinimicrobiota bacterium]
MIQIPIETDRLVIRRFKEKDLKAFLEFMLDAEATQYLTFEDKQKTEGGAKALFDYVCSAYDSGQPIHSYVIAEKSSDRYLGSCGYTPYDEGIYECYYSVNKSEQGDGIATEATRAITEQLARAHELRAYCHPKNYAAHAVARKVGFKPQGIKLHKNLSIESELFVYPKNNN